MLKMLVVSFSSNALARTVSDDFPLCFMFDSERVLFASTDVYVRRRASTDVDARLRQYGTHVKRPARSHQARLRPSTDVNALKIERLLIVKTC